MYVFLFVGGVVTMLKMTPSLSSDCVVNEK